MIAVGRGLVGRNVRYEQCPWPPKDPLGAHL